MSIIKIAAKNFRKHKNLEIDANGQSLVVAGDAGTGKTTVLDIIRICFMQTVMPNDALTDGEEEGFIQVVTDEKDGTVYTITRKFSKKSGVLDFDIRDSRGAKHRSLSTVLERILGPAFKNKFFDWKEYFYETKTSKQRLDYVIKAFGGQEILTNIAAIKTKKQERQSIGSQRTVQWNYYIENGGSVDSDTFEADYAFYKEKKEISIATEAKAAFLSAKLVDIEELEIEKEIVDAVVQRKIGYAESIATKQNRIKDIDAEIKKLQAEKKQLNGYLKIEKQDLLLLDKDAEATSLELQAKIDQAVIDNIAVAEQAEKSYIENVDEIMQFNVKRGEFINNIKAFKEHARLDEEWNKMTSAIDDLIKNNAVILQEKLPIPELSIEVDEKDEEFIFYKGKEFKLGPISTGESIQITAQIQRALNPDGLSFIVIPDAQSLGSLLDPVMEECKKFDLQAIVEITKRDEPFKVVITDDAKTV